MRPGTPTAGTGALPRDVEQIEWEVSTCLCGNMAHCGLSMMDQEQVQWNPAYQTSVV